ncbi:hypothetical protein AK812_SmicGene20311 [Symbiodinium microadriaticum]|uniref:Uncharacterized protein n=1 Tax=Symbiodinium microadriaticum TaxID=2951 RepID=A0A1Q9DQC5_SYMMI|nr:hypothetical protein AK812_SmicGene20311 [Symbiodinium microadriaticum]
MKSFQRIHFGSFKVGSILAFDPATGRYHVQLADGAIRAIRPPHVVARSFASQDEEYGKWTAPAPEPGYVDEPEPPDEEGMLGSEWL